jgi:hypothetical protein
VYITTKVRGKAKFAMQAPLMRTHRAPSAGMSYVVLGGRVLHFLYLYLNEGIEIDAGLY